VDSFNREAFCLYLSFGFQPSVRITFSVFFFFFVWNDPANFRRKKKGSSLRFQWQTTISRNRAAERKLSGSLEVKNAQKDLIFNFHLFFFVVVFPFGISFGQ
jgi:hypothetical protein